MEPIVILLLLGGLLVGATLLGFAWQVRQGRVSRQASSKLPGEVPLELLDAESNFTLLQFSGPFCSYCEAMRGVLSRAADNHPGVAGHREIDIQDYPELTSSLRISQTPTTLIVTHTGHVWSRIHGAAKPPVVEQEIQLAIASRKAASDEYLI
jgi:thiol-disulfide isomerase/thioredoxin